MDSVRSVALGFWIGTGSSAEDGPEAGLSHLIEHMLFRGTARYESLQIDQLFDAMGAELNAGTGKETTSVYARVLDVHLAEALDVMADMVWRPRFDADELAQEREIVLEEIAMYEDDPQDKVFDVLGEAVFGDHPLGRAIIGRAEVVGGAVPAALRRFHATRYVPANVVVAAAGSVDHDALVELVRTSGVERPGLAYNVYSFQSMYAGTGQVGLYLGTRPDNVVRAMAVVADELDRLRQDPASADELARSKENVKGRIVLSLESTTARMNRLGASVLADMPLMSVDEVIERIDAVTLEDIATLARDLFAPERLSAAGIGADPAAFRRAVEPVSPALVGEAVV